MGYLSLDELERMGFKSVGKHVKISRHATVYDCHRIELGDYARIDDFCVISGKVKIGSFVHITPMCLIAGGEPGIVISDFCTLAYGVKMFSQSDDYSGATLTNSLIPKRYKNEIFNPIILDRHVIVGTNTVIFPGVHIAEGCAIGAMSLLTKSTDPWGVYFGTPAYRKKDRKKDLLVLEKALLEEMSHYSI